MNRVPLAERMRPTKLSEVVGQDGIIGEGKILTEIVRKGEPVNLIFWGPPGQVRRRWLGFWRENLKQILWRYRR